MTKAKKTLTYSLKDILKLNVGKITKDSKIYNKDIFKSKLFYFVNNNINYVISKNKTRFNKNQMKI